MTGIYITGDDLKSLRKMVEELREITLSRSTHKAATDFLARVETAEAFPSAHRPGPVGVKCEATWPTSEIVT